VVAGFFQASTQMPPEAYSDATLPWVDLEEGALSPQTSCQFMGKKLQLSCVTVNPYYYASRTMPKGENCAPVHYHITFTSLVAARAFESQSDEMVIIIVIGKIVLSQLNRTFEAD